MKILHIAFSLSDSSAPTRLIKAQLCQSCEIYVYTGKCDKDVDIKNQVYKFYGNIIRITCIILTKLLSIFLKSKNNQIFTHDFLIIFQKYIIKRIINIYKIDVIHLHWSGFSFFPIEVIEHIKIPVVITHHDFGHITGGCHVPMDCSIIYNLCKPCPLFKNIYFTDRINIRAAKNRNILIKNNVYNIAPSSYVENKLKYLLKSTNIITLANTYDKRYVNYVRIPNVHIFTIITVGVNNSNNDNKGYLVLKETIEYLIKNKIYFRHISVGKKFNVPGNYERIHYNNATQDLLLELYSNSDLCLVPSKYETFSQVCLEAILLGVPVIAFNLTGPKDIIEHGVNGLLIEAFNCDKYKNTVLNYITGNLSLNFMNSSIIEKFSPNTVSKNHIELYKLIILNNK
jgi:glycosyltransferase involved in cell wall biosynthesis